MDTLNRDEFPEILSALQEPKSETDGKLFSNGFMTINPEIMVAIAAKVPINTVGFLLSFAVSKV